MFLKSAVIRQIYRAYSSAYSDYIFLRFDAERRISVYLFRLQIKNNDRLICAEKHLPVAYEHIEDKLEIAIELCFKHISVFGYFEQDRFGIFSDAIGKKNIRPLVIYKSLVH